MDDDVRGWLEVGVDQTNISESGKTVEQQFLDWIEVDSLRLPHCGAAAINMYKRMHGPSIKWSGKARCKLEKGPMCPYTDRGKSTVRKLVRNIYSLKVK